MQKHKQVRRKKNRIRARFFSLFITILIISVIGYFYWQTTNTRIPNLHGWESTDVLDFAKDHNIEIEVEFVYSNNLAPTLVISQSISPGTDITEGMILSIEVSKGVEVR